VEDRGTFDPRVPPAEAQNASFPDRQRFFYAVGREPKLAIRMVSKKSCAPQFVGLELRQPAVRDTTQRSAPDEDRRFHSGIERDVMFSRGFGPGRLGLGAEKEQSFESFGQFRGRPKDGREDTVLPHRGPGQSARHCAQSMRLFSPEGFLLEAESISVPTLEMPS